MRAAANTYRAALLAGEQFAIDKLTTHYEVTRQALERALKQLTDYLNLMADADGTVHNATLESVRVRWSELLPEIEAELQGLSEQAAAITEAGQSAGILSAEAHLTGIVDAAIGPKPESVPDGALAYTWNALPADALAAFVGFASDGSPLVDVFRDCNAAGVEKLTQLLFDGLAMGENPRTVAAKMEAFVSGPTRARYETIARTEMLRAVRDATRQTFEENSDVVTGWIWLSAADARTCAACWAMHGTEHEVSEELNSHPQCRCSMAPRTPSWGELLGEGFEDLDDTRPTIPLGVDVFAGLPAAEQKEILGPSLFALYSAGDIGLEHCAHVTEDEKWGPGLQVSTIAQAIEKSEGS